MTITIVPARPEHRFDVVADLVWSVDGPIMRYLFQNERQWQRIVAADWPESKGLVCHGQTVLAVEADAVVGVMVGLAADALDVNAELARDRQTRIVGPSFAAHHQEAQGWLDRVLPHPRENAFYVLALAVTGSARKQGIGRRLMEAAQTKAAALGCSSLCLDVAGDNDALRFYQRLGLVIDVETRVPYLTDNHGIGTHFHMTMPIGGTASKIDGAARGIR
ncbi:MAG: GNAT family N-acetyltransferase [Pseudomonadota bacterium]